MISYEGLFINEEEISKIQEIEEEHLDIINDELHCTFKYHPEPNEIFNDIIGKEYEIKIIGYASNGQNSGFSLELPKELIKYYINIDPDTNKLKIPHITSSLKIGAKASNTKNLNFKPISPITVKCKFGYWIREDTKEYVSYEPYKGE